MSAGRASRCGLAATMLYSPRMRDRYIGTLLGLALGDALGRRREGLLGGDRSVRAPLIWTDDTQMALGLTESLVACRGLDADRLAEHWATTFDPARGYGPGARALLTRIRDGQDWRAANRSVFPQGSFGNGAAMRAAPIGLYYHRDPTALLEAAALASSITHAHPHGIEGGVLIPRAVAWLLREPFDPTQLLDALERGCAVTEFAMRLRWTRERIVSDCSHAEVIKILGTSVAAAESVVTAIHAFCRHPQSFTEMIRYVNELGGDVDTIGAMAGSLFGACRGAAALPAHLIARLEDRERIETLAVALEEASR